LLEKVAIDAKTKCWNWTAAKYGTGYGHFSIGGRGRPAHRVSYELHKGKIPKGMLVCHRCDNRVCINPDHLFLGTAADNAADMRAKKRESHPFGADHGRALLTAADVVAIRAAVGVTQKELGEKYGVGARQIRFIRSGKSWAHLLP